MVQVNEHYEFLVYPKDWNLIIEQVRRDIDSGKDPIITREIGGKTIKGEVVGYSWDGTKKPFSPQKQKIKVKVLEVLAEEAQAIAA